MPRRLRRYIAFRDTPLLCGGVVHFLLFMWSRVFMLVQLNISNFAIIKQLEITFRPGLNILSGETGAGKSIIINAMNLILGGRASADLIRSGCQEAKVEALFSFSGKGVLVEILSELGIPSDEELLISRTVFREGRNKVLVNGIMVTLQMLSRLGAILISISGQYEHQLLLKQENHLYLLDDFGGLTDERQRLSEAFYAHQVLKRKLQKLEKEIEEIGDKQDLARFQVQEIEKADIRLGEDGMLAEEKRRLQHAEELLDVVSAGYQSLYESGDSALTSISQCVKRLEKAIEIDSRLVSIKESLSDIEAKLEDIAFSLRDFQKTIQMDPQRLNEVMERLDLLNVLKRKYGPGIDDVLRFKERQASAMYDLEGKKEQLGGLKETVQGVEKELLEKANALSKRRKQVAGSMEIAVEKELDLLHMGKTSFRVSFLEGHSDPEKQKMHGVEDISAEGFDQVEFMISPNIGEASRPLAKIASGGELSRILLALKTILARTSSVETVIFDEVDSGISGAIAEVVGQKLLSLAQYHQILCITHLPQIASQGQIHFKVMKQVREGRTETIMNELDAVMRVQEIARLLGGKKITPQAVAHAKEMLGS